MELRRSEPDLRFSVVHTSRSEKRKKERSFFPPTAFCGAEGDTRGLMTIPPLCQCWERALPQFPHVLPCRSIHPSIRRSIHSLPWAHRWPMTHNHSLPLPHPACGPMAPALTTSTTISWRRNLRSGAWSCGDKETHGWEAMVGSSVAFIPAPASPSLELGPQSLPKPPGAHLGQMMMGKAGSQGENKCPAWGDPERAEMRTFNGEGKSDPYLRPPIRTSSIPSMWDSISCTIRAFLSTSSALFMPLLILSATCLMLRWASMRKGWSGWSSGVCFSRSCHGDRDRLSPLPAPGHWQCHCPSPSQAALAAGDGSSPKEGVDMSSREAEDKGTTAGGQQGDCPQSDHLQESRAMCIPGDINFVTRGGKWGEETPESPES